MPTVKGFYKRDGKTRPITESEGKSHRYTGQESDPSWKQSSQEDIKKDLADEKDDETAYRHQAKKAHTEKERKTYTGIANDEADHQKKLRAMRDSDPPTRTKETYTYHGRTGHPIVHRTVEGQEYIMVRATGGGDKRLYLTPDTKQKLESKEGYTE